VRHRLLQNASKALGPTLHVGFACEQVLPDLELHMRNAALLIPPESDCPSPHSVGQGNRAVDSRTKAPRKVGPAPGPRRASRRRREPSPRRRAREKRRGRLVVARW